MDDIFVGRGTPLSDGGFGEAATKLSVGTDAQGNRRANLDDRASLWALLAVETRGFGYLPDRRPKILFERHIFHSRTAGRFSRSHPDISSPLRGNYSGGAAEYGRLKRAMLLDRRSALESASWGLGQIMGFNAVGLGYASVEAMVERFKDSEAEQLEGSVRFITNNAALLAAFRTRRWPRVAFFYNGKSYAENRYDEKLRAKHSEFTAKSPDIKIREVQAYLTYLGYDPRGVDGIAGTGTNNAIERYRRDRRITGAVTVESVAADLRRAAGFT